VKSKLHIMLAAILTLLIVSCQGPEMPVNPIDQNQEVNSLRKSSGTEDVIPGQYIIVLKSDVSRVPDVANEMAKIHAATIGFVYQHSIKGFSARMSAQAAANLAKNPNVFSIEPDKIIQIDPVIIQRGKPGGGGTSPAQITPWGITRVGGATTYSGSAVAWIIDTGIDLDNPDLNVDAARSVTFVNSKSANDDNGHGTHVAGTVAAKDNDIYVVGVAAGAKEEADLIRVL